MKKTLTLLACLLLVGCVPRMVMRSQDQRQYSTYVKDTQQLNFDREKSGLQPQHIMTYDEWSGKK